MNANICWLRWELDLQLRRWRYRRIDVDVETMNLRRSCTDERVRYRVFSGVASFQMRRAVRAVCDDTVMIVSRETVVVLRVIVIVVDVGVQHRHCPRGGHPRRNEQQRQRTAHDHESMGRGQSGSKVADNRRLVIGFRQSPPESEGLIRRNTAPW